MVNSRWRFATAHSSRRARPRVVWSCIVDGMYLRLPTVSMRWNNEPLGHLIGDLCAEVCPDDVKAEIDAGLALPADVSTRPSSM